MPLLFPFERLLVQVRLRLQEKGPWKMASAESIMFAKNRAARPLVWLALLAAAAAHPAAAQQALFNQDGNSNLNAINSGDISLRGNVTNPTVNGGIDNQAGTLTAQGASSSFSINDANLDAQGNAIGSYTAHVSDTKSGGINSGSVSVRATITGGALNANNTSQSVSATGMSNVISIKTTGK